MRTAVISCLLVCSCWRQQIVCVHMFKKRNLQRPGQRGQRSAGLKAGILACVWLACAARLSDPASILLSLVREEARECLVPHRLHQLQAASRLSHDDAVAAHVQTPVAYDANA